MHACLIRTYKHITPWGESTEAHMGHVVQLHGHVIFHCGLPLHAILPLHPSIANASNSIATLLAKLINSLDSAHEYIRVLPTAYRQVTD